ncbi:hypothetical protein G3N95_29745 [Paraburkholderia sp. Tr-20389]|uniref:hypothetical protein n=1 Tax=Paraburkholderia sp. Tr-20389 TaxID=2703903 RepID=UPI00197FCC41|nr:hypothetical protein [Paraburkholderia sp. Tr-20389]MBN3757158.1 hypothetical protein [Paraburkholderia sp. Tr-20389]
MMTIHRDDGVDRHITFKTPGTSCYWFEILTWPGALCIRGDCGTYVFSRLTDMFEFFRSDDRGDPQTLYINEGYWREKLQAVNNCGYGKGSVVKFSQEDFEQHVMERVEGYLEGYAITDERRAELMERIQDEVLGNSHDGEVRAFDALNEFHDEEFPRLFEDCWEWRCEEYDFSFLWNAYAIAWAIRKYDAAKAEKRAA